MPPVTSGFAEWTFADYDDERSNVRVHTTPLLDDGTNYVGQVTARNNFQAALAAMTLGTRQKQAFGNMTKNTASFPNDKAAQRELKWLVQCTSNVTMRDVSFEIPCANTDLLDPNDRAHAFIGDGADVDAFVTQVNAFVRDQDGNGVTVREITLVGRNV